MQRKSHAKLREDAHRMFMRNSLDESVKVALNEEFREVNPIARKVLTDDGLLEFLADYLNREWTKLQAFRDGTPSEHPYDGQREDSLCTCPDRFCPLKAGKLPRPIRTAEDPLEALRQFKQSHGGDPLVFHEATDAYDELCTDFDYHHRRIIICAQYNIPPEDLEGTTLTHDEDETNTGAPADD